MSVGVNNTVVDTWQEHPLQISGRMDMNTITFQGANSEPIIELKPNGDIFVHGRLAENDKEVVDGLRDFLAGLHLKE
jgi:hypothetical protein